MQVFDRRRPVDLPRRGRLTPTGPVDAVADYYGVGFGTVLRRRLAWVRDALPPGQLRRVLDVGFGSGIFIPELARRASAVFGADVHPHAARARAELAEEGVEATLVRADGMALPFRDGSFDAVVIVSALEFISDPGLALAESLRVTRAGGAVIAVAPRTMRWADRLYTMLVGFDPETDFRGGRARVQQALESTTLPITRHPRPRGFPRSMALYELIVLRAPERARVSAPDRFERSRAMPHTARRAVDQDASRPSV
jgi:ubiquinone/menaquinone biosynthesis C-methylase UbiE